MCLYVDWAVMFGHNEVRLKWVSHCLLLAVVALDCTLYNCIASQSIYLLVLLNFYGKWLGSMVFSLLPVGVNWDKRLHIDNFKRLLHKPLDLCWMKRRKKCAQDAPFSVHVTKNHGDLSKKINRRKRLNRIFEFNMQMQMKWYAK